MVDQFMELGGVDITREPMEVGPTCHYAMGGIKVDAETGASRVPGLYAAGECTGGMNGANRLGGNSLSDLLVFGRRAGEGAAAHANSAPAPQVDDAQVAEAVAEMNGYFEGPGGEDPYAVHADLQETMQTLVGIYREESGLVRALDRLEELKERAERVRVREGGRDFNPGWHLCRDLQNMLTCAEAVTRAALMREESRGAHSRLDFPDYADFWGEHNIVVFQAADGMAVEPRPVVKVAELEPLVEERKAAERAAVPAKVEQTAAQEPR
jgi:succinate dehydrogenase / fumarate reductase flavoprotein subunit